MPLIRNATLADLRAAGLDVTDTTPGVASRRPEATDVAVSVLVHCATPNPTNVRAHHMARYRQVKDQYKATWAALFDIPREARATLALGCVVTLTRISVGTADDDGLRACLKSVRDCVAVWLFDGRPGEMDNDSRAEWKYAAEKGKRNRPAVRIEIEPRV